MELGFYLPNSGDGATREDLANVARRVEESGFGSAWVADHIVAPTHVTSPYPFHPEGMYHNRPSTPYLEPLTALAFAAAVTERVRLVLSVLIAPYRHPLMNAKVAASVDVLSGGRLTLGVGVGWMEEEFRALGHDYFADRGAVTDEQIEIMRKAWTGEVISHAGRFYSFDELMVVPTPLQDPLPIWIGGHSRAALRRAVKYGEAVNLNAMGPEDVRLVTATLQELSEKHGRSQPPEVTLRGHLLVSDKADPFEPGHIIGPINYLVERLQEYRELGVASFGVDNRVDGIERIRTNLDQLVSVTDKFGGSG